MAFNLEEWYLRTKQVVLKTGAAYLSFVAPAAVFFAFNMCVDTHSRDLGKFGLLWLHYNRVDPEDRPAMYPLKQKGDAGMTRAVSVEYAE